MDMLIDVIGDTKKTIIFAINVEKQAVDFFDIMAEKAETEKSRINGENIFL